MNGHVEAFSCNPPDPPYRGDCMLFFAYGSLLNQNRLREVCATAIPLEVAKIPHHSLCFTGHSRAWGGGTATIGLSPGRNLWGALYEVDAAGRRAIERSGEEDGYVWSFTPVELAEGELLTPGMLVKVRGLERSAPSQAYLDVLRSGWQQWGLDPETILRDIARTL